MKTDSYSGNLSLICIQAFHVDVTSATTLTRVRGENRACTSRLLGVMRRSLWILDTDGTVLRPGLVTYCMMSVPLR